MERIGIRFVVQYFMLRDVISFVPIGIDLNALYWGIVSTLVMYLVPTCVAFAVIYYSVRRRAEEARVVPFPGPAERKEEEERRRAA